MPRSPPGLRRSFSPRARDRDRDRDRGRERTRERSREREREHRDGDRRRDRSWERDRLRDDRDRDRRRGRDRSRERGQERGQERPRERDRDLFGRDRRERLLRAEEDDRSPILVIKGLKPDTSEDTISKAMEKRGSGPLKDVRIVRDKISGNPRGFAFVEFLTPRDAGRFVENCANDTLFIDDVPISIEFSRKRDENSQEWTCFRCDAANARWRDSCHLCHRKKPALPSLDEVDPPMDGAAEAGTVPSNVLIFRGLDALTTELTITEAVRAHTALPIKDVRLIKDRLTNTSRGFAFVELNSVTEAAQLLESLQFLDPHFSIDSKHVHLGFARQPQVNPAQAKSGAAAIQAAQWSSRPKPASDSGASATPTAAPAAVTRSTESPALDPKRAFEAGFLAAQQQANVSMAGYHAATAQLATQAAVASHAAKVYESEATKLRQEKQTATATEFAKTFATNQTGSGSDVSEDAKEVPIGPMPAPTVAVAAATDTAAVASSLGSSYTYDASSGYYYDSTSGLYYDPNTQYHYNPATQQYCYYDMQTHQYVPVQANSAVGFDDKKDKKKKKEGGVPSARKIARDMERWAKSLNAAKDATKAAVATAVAAKAAQAATQQLNVLRSVERAPLSLESLQAARQVEARFEQGMKKSVMSGTFLGQEAPSEPLNFDGSKNGGPESVVDDWKTKMQAMSVERKQPSPPPPQRVKEEPSFVIPEGADPEPSHTDWKQVACLLCKRKFPNPSTLVRHQQLSDLHKQNLAAKGLPPLPVTMPAAAGSARPTARPTAPAQMQRPPPAAATQRPRPDTQHDSSGAGYRDRAAERRTLHGPSEPVPRRGDFGRPPAQDRPLPFGFGGEPPKIAERSPPRQPDPYAQDAPYEQPTRGGLGASNVGNRMMQAMGWSEGEGLGREAQGRTDAIQAHMRANQAGLGSRGSDYGAYHVNDSRRETMSRLTQARFRESEY